METTLFRPNLRNVSFGILIFLICSFIIWVPEVQILLKFGSDAFEVLEFSNFIFLPLIFLFSYFLSSIFIYNFNFNHLKQIPSSLKLIILFLLFEVFSLIMHILSGIAPGSGNGFIQGSEVYFTNFPILFAILLLTSIIFLLIKLKYNWIFGSLFFLYLLFNPFPPAGSLRGLTYSSGPIIAMFEGLFAGDITTSLVMLFSSLFYIFIIIYLFIALRNNFKLEFSEKIMFILLIVSFIIKESRLAVAIFTQQGINLPIMSYLFFFGILFGWRYYSSKN